MESRENNLIAQKLNSLQTLPDGYTPNLSSKWELVQAAMEGRNNKARNKTLVGVAFLIIAAGLAMWSLSSHDRAIGAAPAIPNKMPFVTRQAIAPVSQHVKPLSLKPKQKTISRPVNALRPIAKKDSVLLQPMTVQQPAPVTDTIQLRRDTLKAVAPIAKLRLKARVYQRDFEGITTAADTVNTKTATKTFSLKFNPHKAEESSHDWRPALHIHQNF